MNNLDSEIITGKEYEIFIRKEADDRWFWRVITLDPENKFEYGTEVTRSTALEKAVVSRSEIRLPPLAKD